MIKEKTDKKNEYLSFNRDEVFAIRETYFQLYTAVKKMPCPKSKRKDTAKFIEYCDSMLNKCNKFLYNEEEIERNV